MAALSDYLEKKIADHIFGGGDFTRPATVYVALYTVAPTDSTAGTEVSGSGYARASVANNVTNFPASTDGSKKNATSITFPEATGSWGIVTAFAVFDAATSGNMLVHGSLDSSKTFAAGDTPKINVNQLNIQFN